jgi:hypothetical protein
MSTGLFDLSASEVAAALFAELRFELLFLGVFTAVYCYAAFGNKKNARSTTAPVRTYRSAAAPRSDRVPPTQLLVEAPRLTPSEIAELAATRYAAALEAFSRGVTGDLEEMVDMMTQLILASVRVGRLEEVPNMLQYMKANNIPLQLAMLSSVTKLTTSKQLFADCLKFRDLFPRELIKGCPDRSLWSCWLFCSIETAQPVDACVELYRKLRDCGAPTDKDISNLLRIAGTHQDFAVAKLALDDMVANGNKFDSVALSSAVSVGYATHNIDQVCDAVEKIGVQHIVEMVQAGVRPTVPTMQVVLKLLVRSAGGYESAYELLEKCGKHYGARADGRRLFTYLVSTAIRQRSGKRALDAFDLSVANAPVPLRPNAVTCGQYLAACVSFNMVDTGKDLVLKMKDLGMEIPTLQAEQLREHAVKKGKKDIAAAVAGAITA